MPRIGPWEIVIILAVVMIIFGVGKLPQIGGAMGKTLREFRKGQKEIEEVTKPTSENEK